MNASATTEAIAAAVAAIMMVEKTWVPIMRNAGAKDSIMIGRGHPTVLKRSILPTSRGLMTNNLSDSFELRIRLPE
jgi:hypothetical protein